MVATAHKQPDVIGTYVSGGALFDDWMDAEWART